MAARDADAGFAEREQQLPAPGAFRCPRYCPLHLVMAEAQLARIDQQIQKLKEQLEGERVEAKKEVRG